MVNIYCNKKCISLYLLNKYRSGLLILRYLINIASKLKTV